MDTPFGSLDDRSLEKAVRHYEALIRRQSAGLEEYEVYVLCLREWVRRKAERRTADVAPPVPTSIVGLVAAGVFRVTGPRT